MARLLATRGYSREAEHLLRFGFTPDGSIASSPAW